MISYNKWFQDNCPRRKLPPPKTNPNPNPNPNSKPNPNRGAIFLRGNCPDTIIKFLKAAIKNCCC